MNSKPKISRKTCPPIKVYCLPEDRAQIKANAESVGLTLSTYLLNVGVGYKVESIIDQREVMKLLAINGDLGRLGGLIKLWLTNDERVAMVGATTLFKVLARIEANQKALMNISKTVLKIRRQF